MTQQMTGLEEAVGQLKDNLESSERDSQTMQDTNLGRSLTTTRV